MIAKEDDPFGAQQLFRGEMAVKLPGIVQLGWINSAVLVRFENNMSWKVREPQTNWLDKRFENSLFWFPHLSEFRNPSPP